MKSCFATLCGILLLCGCSPEPPPAMPSPTAPTASGKAPHEQAPMVEVLANLAKEADPEKNYHLNSEKAELLKSQVLKGGQSSIVFQYAVQLLRAGKTDKAIAQFKKMLRASGGANQGINRQNKMVFELLALAYLRKGEQENCIANHNSDSCIIPLTQKALHVDKSGSRQAIDIYQRILGRFPSDLQSGYLYRVASMTIGEEAGLPLESDSEVIPNWKNIATELHVDLQSIAGGCAIDDFNNDGWLDLVVSSYGYEDQVRYYENNQKGGFEDKTKNSGLEGIVGGINVNHVDYNNDGNLDVYLMRGGWLGAGGKQPNSLLRGNGDGTFQDVTQSVGLDSKYPTHASVWADFDLDGNLDLFVGNESSDFDYGDGRTTSERQANPCELFIGRNDGTFTDVASETGLDIQKFVKGVTAADYNNDGLPDLFVSIVNEDNLLFWNESTPGKLRFRKADPSCGALNFKFTFPTWSWDFDQDGNEDIFVAGYPLPKLKNVSGEYFAELKKRPVSLNRPALYRNNGDGTFTDVAPDVGLNKSLYAMGCNFGDLDKDGHLDFYVGTGAPDFRSIVPNRMFRSVNGVGFEEVSFQGFSHIQKGHGIGWGDFDQDGDEDIYTVMGGAFEGDIAPNAMFQNPGNENNWVVLRLQGTQANRAAIGARVKLVITESGQQRTLWRTVGTGSSFGSNSLQLEIGVGEAETINEVIIDWPSTEKQKSSFSGLEVNQIYKIQEGAESAEVISSDRT